MRSLAILLTAAFVIGCGGDGNSQAVKGNIAPSKDVATKNKKTAVVTDKLDDLPPLPGAAN